MKKATKPVKKMPMEKSAMDKKMDKLPMKNGKKKAC